MRHLAGILICASVVLMHTSVFAPGGEFPQAQVREVDFALCREIPVGITAGTPDRPRLVEVQWIRIEPKELPRGVTVHVGWSPAAEATWRIAVDLLDDQGLPLPDARENAVVFTGKAGASADTGTHYADLDLGYKSFRTRRYAAKVRVSLERVSDQGADATASPPFQIKVIDGKTRKPLTDVAIVVQAYYEAKRLGSEVFLCQTDAEGMCRITGLKPASISFVTQKDGYGMMLCGISARPASEPKVVELRAAEPIGGVVQDQAGRPITEVEVEVNASSTEVGGMAYINRIVRTDKDGSWRVNGVPSEAESVSVGLKHLEYVSNSAVERTIALWRLADDQSPKHVDRLTRGVSIDGRVVDANGQPLPRVAVTLAPPRRGGFQYGCACVLTDASGHFHFGCGKDTRGDRNTGDAPTAVYAEAPGYAPMMKTLSIEPSVPPLEFRLTTGRTVTIHTVNPDGQPLPGASVQLYPLAEDPGNSISLKLNADEQGRLQVAHVPDGEMRMTVERRSYLTIKDHVLPASSKEYTLTMVPAARVQGTVCDADTGQPIPHFRATLTEATDFDVIQFQQSAEFNDGKYEFSPKEKVSIDLWLIVSAPGYKGAKSEAFRLEEGMRQMDFKLVKAASVGKPAVSRASGVRVVRGLVQDPNGRPAAKVTVMVCIVWATSTTTDAEGKFKMLCSPMGPGSPSTWHLVARDSAHSLAALVELDETSTGDLLVRLAPAMIITGRVVDPQGKGIPGVRLLPMLITETSAGQGLVNASMSDPNGYFEIRDLPPGHNYTLWATADGYGEGHADVRTNEVVNNRVDLKPLVLLQTNLKVSGVVVTPEDKPIVGASVYSQGGGQPFRNVISDAQGRFTLEKICAGPIAIYARTGGKDGLHGSAQAKGGDTDVRIIMVGGGAKTGTVSSPER